jgi:hypothetical protein
MVTLYPRHQRGNEMASFSFNTADAPAPQAFDLVPEGNYPAVALSSEVRETKSGGEMIVYKMQITDGPQANRILWARFNVKNANPKAEEIGRGQLSQFCRAAGVEEMADTDDLVGRAVIIRVKIRPAKDGYDAQNEIGGFAAIGAKVAPPAAQAPAAPAPKAAPGQARPWQKAA